MVNLTNKLVASVKPPRDKKYIRLWDSNISGFGLRVTDKGVKSFIFEGRQGLSKKTKQVKIGRVGEMSVAEARTNAAELSRKFRSGDRSHPASNAHSRARLYSDVHSVTFDHLGHTPELEEPALVLDAITNFVDRS